MLLLLQRAAETVSGDDECNDPAVLLACALGSTGCPAKCADSEKETNNYNAFSGVVAGDLNMAVSTSSSITSIPNNGIIKVAELSVKASEDIQLQSLDVIRGGLSNNSNIKVWIEKDGRRITSSSSFFGDSKANLTFNNGGYVVKGDETLDLVVSLSGYDQGAEINFKVANVTSSAKNTTVSPDTTGTFRTTTYSATSISFVQIANPDRNYNLANDSTFSFGEFKLQNDAKASMEKDVMIKSITFKVDGKDVSNLNSMKLFRDGKEISSKYTVDGKSVTFAVNNVLESGKSATYKITAVPTNVENAVTNVGGGDDYKFSIKKAEDVIAEEIGDNATAYRVTVNNLSVVDLGTTYIKGGNITLTRDSKLASTVSADWGYSDVTVAKGTIKVNQAVKFEDGVVLYLKDTSAATINENAGVRLIGLDKVVRRAALVINGKTYQATSITSTGLVFNTEIFVDRGTHDAELQLSLYNSTEGKFAIEAGVSLPKDAWLAKGSETDNTDNTAGTDDVRLPAGDTAVAGTKIVVKKLVFDDLAAAAFKGGLYTNGDETKFEATKQIAGSIRVADVNIAAKTMSIKKVGPAEDFKVSAGNTDERVVLEAEISNSTDKNFDLSQIIVKPEVSIAGVAADEKIADVYIALVDGSASSTVAVNNNTNEYTIDSISKTLAPNESVKIEVRVIPSADLQSPDNFRLSVYGKGTLEGNSVKTSSVYSARITSTDGATANVVVSSNTKNFIALPGTSTQIASFNYNVKGDSVDVDKVVIGVDNNLTTAMLDDVTIDFDGIKPALTYAVNASHELVLTFNNIESLPAKNYNVKVYATFNENAIVKPVAPATTAAQNTYTVGTVQIANGTASSSLGITYYVAKAYPMLSVKEKNTNSGNERLDVNAVSNTSDYKVVLNAIFANGDGVTAYDPSDDETSDSANVFNKTSGTAGVFQDIVLGTSSEVARSTTKKTAVQAVSFTVTDDEGKEAVYAHVNASTIADFASLSL